VAEVLAGRRVVASPAAIDNAVWPASAMVLRIAPDDALLVGDGPIEINDPHAIVEPDGGFCAVRLAADRVIDLLAANASWQLSDERPCLAQGMVAGLPVKVWMEDNWALLICPTPFAFELEARLL
jgi:hypothetical protein